MQKNTDNHSDSSGLLAMFLNLKFLWVGLTVLYILVFDPSSAFAQCVNDLDCDGDQVCIEEKCQLPDADAVAPSETPPTTEAPVSNVAPVPVPVPAPVPAVVAPAPTLSPAPVATVAPQYAQPQYSQPAPAMSSGWALGAGIAGLVLSPFPLGLSIGAELNKSDLLPTLPLGITAGVMVIVMSPVVAAGGGSARKRSGVRGALGLRIPAWILYGISVASYISLLPFGILEIEPFDGQLAISGVMGTTSILLLSIDALVCRRQVRKLNVVAQKEKSTYALAPIVSPITTANQGTTGAMLGMSAQF